MAEEERDVEIKHDKLIVVAIDFGTTYSGYAHCTRNEYEDKSKLPNIRPKEWNDDGNHITLKAPTCVLFDPDKKFDCFGYEATNKYRKNPGKLDLSKWYYFEHFKMMLYKEKEQLSKETWLVETIDIEDEKLRKKMKAVDVFAAVIKYFKDDLLEKKSLQGTSFVADDIQWVITVPAIWDLKAKQFMRDAANQAGIKHNQLTLALEPEAASLYCRKIPVSVTSDEDGARKISSMEIGTKYVVLDQGGGTTDIAVHEVTGKNTLKEIHQACGGHWGGITVNGEFFSFLKRLVGGDVINHVKSTAPGDYYELLFNFEHCKISFTHNHSQEGSEFQTLRLPVTWLHAFTEITECSLEKTLKQSNFKGKVKLKNDKMRIQNELFRSFYDFSIEHVLEELESILRFKELADVATILVVGGHSKSDILTNAVNERFGNKYDVVVPKDPEIAVLRGAVLFGFNPEMITSRVLGYTYGIAIQRDFKPGVDSESKRECLVNGLVDNVFDKHVEIGQVVKIGEFLPEHDYVPARREYKGAHFQFYATKEKNPKYVTDEGCSCIGVIYFELTDVSNRRDMTLKINVSGTEIVAVITEKSSGIERNGYFQLL